jgi:YidC/Oxa1 family membrane protein insertase
LRDIVFYSEGTPYGGFLRPVVKSLIEEHGRSVSYITSDAHDPALTEGDGPFQTYFIGHESARIFLFEMMQAGIVIMTMPDLNTFHIKRSRYRVHFAHLLHSMVSTHMIYRKGAFDHFDSVFCTGPHQAAEIREWERLNGLPKKQVFEHGYCPLDLLMDAAARHPGPPPGDGPLNILVAPSWGPEGLLEAWGERVVDILLDAGHRVHVRPHPRTRQLASTVLDDLDTRFRDHPSFRLDEDTTDPTPLLDAHVLVSDWSGVALEYAFALERPVLFIDVPRKVNNPDYTRLSVLPLEVDIREQIGAVLAPERLTDAPRLVKDLVDSTNIIRERASALRQKWVFNVGAGGRRGAEIILRILDQLRPAGAQTHP